MVLLITNPSRFVFSHCSIVDCPNLLSPFFVILPRRQPSALVKERGSLAFSRFERRGFGSSIILFQRCSYVGFVRQCKSWESEGDPALEADILEFMQNSENPNVFPTKKELINAGRMDLVEGIGKQGGWLALGWDLHEEETFRGDEFRGSNWIMETGVDDDCYVNRDTRIFQHRVDIGDELLSSGDIEVGSSGLSSSSSSSKASSSDRSIEMEDGADAGIEGILNRLEKERSLHFGVGPRKKESNRCVLRNEDEDDWRLKISADAVSGLERSIISTSLNTSKDLLADTRDMRVQKKSFSDFDDIISSLKPQVWRTWNIQMTGFSNTEFEAAEGVPTESRMGRVMDAMDNQMFTKEKGSNETGNISKELDSGVKENEVNQIRSHLQNLEVELASVLGLLRSRTDAIVLHKDHESSLEEVQRLSDAWEFQETAIMNTQNRLRSTRAKLVVLEGKMALAIIEAQKIIKEKQKRIDDARKALRLLHTACIVWPNSGSEVLLAGSFDGWASQRQMERSSTGIFSLCLKLYPGRYEIKFIVDGVWRLDPLRPIVHNNGYDNNILIIS